MAAMNFFTSELKKIADHCDFIDDMRLAGRVCMFRLSDEVTGRLEFSTDGMADIYSALQISLFNRKEGLIDSLLIPIVDMIGVKHMCGDIKPGKPDMTAPYICRYGKIGWHGFEPSDEDYSLMAQETDNYLEMFAEPQINENMGIEM